MNAIISAIVATLLFATQSLAQSEQANTDALEVRFVEGAGFGLALPDSFTYSERYSGYAHRDDTMLIQILEFPVSEWEPIIARDLFELRDVMGMVLAGEPERLQINGMPAFRLGGEARAEGQNFQRCILVARGEHRVGVVLVDLAPSASDEDPCRYTSGLVERAPPTPMDHLLSLSFAVGDLGTFSPNEQFRTGFATLTAHPDGRTDPPSAPLIEFSEVSYQDFGQDIEAHYRDQIQLNPSMFSIHVEPPTRFEQAGLSVLEYQGNGTGLDLQSTQISFLVRVFIISENDHLVVSGFGNAERWEADEAALRTVMDSISWKEN